MFGELIVGNFVILLLFTLAGLLLGVLSGALPGMSVLTAVVVFLPVTYTMPVENALAFLIAMYAGGTYGGSALAILLNIPGGPENACSTLDGYPLTQKGLAGRAIVVAILSSGIGGLFGAIVLMVLAPAISQLALGVTPAQIMGVTFLALCASGILDSSSATRAYAAAAGGVLLACIGLEPLHGITRLTFGVDALASGLDFVAVIIGALALSEVFVRMHERASTGGPNPKPAQEKLGRLHLPERKVFTKLVPVWARNSVLGTVIGILPGAGATAASFMAYSAEKRVNREGERFGTGEYAGIAAPESANNAAAMTSLVPLLTLGIPGGAVAAVLYGVLTIHGLQPGPLMATSQPALMNTVFVAALLANAMILVVGVFEAKNVIKILKVPEYVLLPIVVVFATIGSYSLNNNIVDVWVTLFFGLVGAYMRLRNYSVVALTLGIILGPIMENAFAIGHRTAGSYWFLLHDPVAVIFILGSLLLVFFGPVRKLLKRKPGAALADRPSSSLRD